MSATLTTVRVVFPGIERAAGRECDVVDSHVSREAIIVCGNDVNSEVRQTNKGDVGTTPYISLVTGDIFH